MPAATVRIGSMHLRRVIQASRSSTRPRRGPCRTCERAIWPHCTPAQPNRSARSAQGARHHAPQHRAVDEHLAQLHVDGQQRQVPAKRRELSSLGQRAQVLQPLHSRGDGRILWRLDALSPGTVRPAGHACHAGANTRGRSTASSTHHTHTHTITHIRPHPHHTPPSGQPRLRPA